jgi:3-hydroxyisobutyrate dehydrogenase-like beta-hydroxyacid dehydrogenase
MPPPVPQFLWGAGQTDWRASTAASSAETMAISLSLIGFGEAGTAFATGAGWGTDAQVFDIKTGDAKTRDAKLAEYQAAGVAGLEGPTGLGGLILSLVTADEALNAAQSVVAELVPDALYCDMNSVAPDTKRAAAAVIEAAGGRYVDVAVMSPVYPAQMAVPLLVSGPHAEAGDAALAGLGFTNIRMVGDAVGDASAIKMIRSVMIKGMEALTAECMLAAMRAGVLDEVLDSLGGNWRDQANYNLDRMMVHGLRRAAEMKEVVKTLNGLGIQPKMSEQTVEWQESVGDLRHAPAGGLREKLAAILSFPEPLRGFDE